MSGAPPLRWCRGAEAGLGSWAALALLQACAAAAAGDPAVAGTARPPDCRELAAGEPVQAALDAVIPGGALCLSPGEHQGPVVVGQGVTLWGPAEAVLRSPAGGTTVRLEAPGATLLGLTVDGTGGRYDFLDAAVRVSTTGARVEGVRVVHAVFGILVERSRSVVIRGNEVVADAGVPLGLRGDGIRVWETEDSLLEDNHLVGARDLVVWYSRRNRIAGNQVESGRYGTHLMFAHDNVIERNRYLENVVGVFVMYSRDVIVRDNLVAASTGAAGMGLGLKESGNLLISGNLLVKNTVGIYVDASPLQLGEQNRIEHNDVRLGQTGVVLHGSERRNDFLGNSFRDNLRSVEVEGGADALGVVWSGNYYDEYTGYDLDRDGRGDVPFELRSLSGDLIGREPSLEFFRGAPALTLVDTVSHVAPLFEPRLVLVDPRPLLVPREAGAARAN